MKYLKRIKGKCTECYFFERPTGAMSGACTDWPGRNACMNDPLSDYCFRLATMTEITAYNDTLYKRKNPEQHMNKRMVKLADKIYSLFGSYIKAYLKEFGDPDGFVYIKSSTGEISCFAQDIDTLKKNVTAMKRDKP